MVLRCTQLHSLVLRCTQLHGYTATRLGFEVYTATLLGLEVYKATQLQGFNETAEILLVVSSFPLPKRSACPCSTLTPAELVL